MIIILNRQSVSENTNCSAKLHSKINNKNKKNITVVLAPMGARECFPVEVR